MMTEWWQLITKQWQNSDRTIKVQLKEDDQTMTRQWHSDDRRMTEVWKKVGEVDDDDDDNNGMALWQFWLSLVYCKSP